MEKTKKNHFYWLVLFLWAALLALSVFHVVGSDLRWFRLVNVGEVVLSQVPEVSYPDDFEVNVGGGYDGSTYYVVAYDLMPEKAHVGLIRYRRILYPAISKMLSFGNLSRGMFLANVLGIMVFAWACVKLADSPRKLLCLIAQPAIWFSLQYGLVDLWGMAMLAWVLVLWPKHPLCASLFFLLACLARETMLIFVVGLFVSCLIKRDFKLSLYPLVVAILWGMWSLLLKMMYPEAEMQGGVVFPFSGWWIFLRDDLHIKDLPQLILVVWMLLSFYWCIKNSKDPWMIAIFMFLGAMLCAKSGMAEHFLSAGRLLSPVMFLLTVRLLQERDWKLKSLSYIGVILFVLCAYRQFVVTEEIDWFLWQGVK